MTRSKIYCTARLADTQFTGQEQKFTFYAIDDSTMMLNYSCKFIFTQCAEFLFRKAINKTMIRILTNSSSPSQNEENMMKYRRLRMDKEIGNEGAGREGAVHLVDGRHARHVDPVDVDVHADPPQHPDDSLPVALLDALVEHDLVREPHAPLAGVRAREETGAPRHLSPSLTTSRCCQPDAFFLPSRGIYLFLFILMFSAVHITLVWS